MTYQTAEFEKNGMKVNLRFPLTLADENIINDIKLLLIDVLVKYSDKNDLLNKDG